MSIRMKISGGVVAVVALVMACTAAAKPDTTLPPDTTIRCPDDCTHSNGTAVYTGEGGYAGIGEYKLMITHFINHGGSEVTFEGRYFHGPSQQWQLVEGVVGTADYPGARDLVVTALSETATVPTWTLLDRLTQTTVTVTDSQLADLRLHLRFVVPPGNAANPEQIALTFGPTSTVQGNSTVHLYPMLWRDEKSSNAAAPYCLEDVQVSQSLDPVVFQQGIAVHPVHGAVTRSADIDQFVTLSCAHGAPATVYSWGYKYRRNPKAPGPGPSPTPPASTFYFDAGIQMKRASYCADAEYYTIAGTQLEIADDRLINDTRPGNLEAMWTPQGAQCLNGANKRHNAIATAKGFQDSCHGSPLPACPPLPPPPPPHLPHFPSDPFLTDGPIGPPPWN